MLKELAVRNYFERDTGCTEAVLMAGNTVYHLGLKKDTGGLFSAFDGGMGRQETCGALSGTLAVLGMLYASANKDGPDGITDVAAEFVTEFEKKLGSIKCASLRETYRTEDARCSQTVALAAELLEEYASRIIKTESHVTVSEQDIKRVKRLGCLQRRGTDLFNMRVVTRNGKLTNAELRRITEGAERFGNGEVAFTTRLCVEIQAVPYENIEPLRAWLGQGGLESGGTGARVRPVVACKGTTCQYGLYDAHALSEAAHELFYEGYAAVKLPHKFKIAFGGCPNNCVKPNLNDIGVVGQRMPGFNAEKCRGCGSCAVEKACPVHAASVKDGKLFIDPAACLNCGRCVGKCPFHAIETGEYGFRVYIGGRWGKKTALGRPLTRIFTSADEVMEVIESSILLFKDKGVAGERFADTIERIGFENAEAELVSGELLARKAEILADK